jgi:uncharacterized protein YycO
LIPSEDSPGNGVARRNPAISHEGIVMKRRVATAGAALCAAAMLAGTVPAAANAAPSAIEELAALNPETTTTELSRDLAQYAKSKNISVSQATNEVLAEARSSQLSANSAKRSASKDAGLSLDSSGSGSTVVLGSAARRGDIFISPASTLFVEHGHTGIYYTTSVVVEAPGGDKLSRAVATSTYRVGSGSIKQYISATTTQRESAANLAYGSLRGKEYNFNFAFNRNAYGTKMNCSQLVWAAYLRTTGLDLDGNGGTGVYPYNIRDHSRTVKYQTL